MPQWLVIGISGVTCGGKTTLSHNLRDYFQNKQNSQLWQTPYTIGDVQLLSQDNYFLPVDDRRHEWIDKLNAINFELLTSLDMKQMLSDITWTMKGRYLVGDPMENIDYMNDMSLATNFEQYTQSQLMPPPPVPPLAHYTSNKVQQQQQQQQQQQHYHQNVQYYAAQLNHHHHPQHQHQHHQHPQQSQSQPPQHTQQPLLPPQQQQQLQHHRQYQIQQQQQQQQQQHHQQRHPMRIACTAVNHQTIMKLRDYKINILIIEGFMIFNQPELLTLCNIKFHFHLPYEKCFERRQRRTYEPPDVTGYFEMCVWPYYEKNFAEYRDRTDITFLNGEIDKDRICDFALQKIMKYVQERCDVFMTTTPLTTFTAPPPHKMIGIHHNGNNSTAKPCPMEQQ